MPMIAMMRSVLGDKGKKPQDNGHRMGGIGKMESFKPLNQLTVSF